MMDEKKSFRGPLTATAVLLVLPALYVLSYGLYVGLANTWHMSGRPASSEWVFSIGHVIYAPLDWLGRFGPQPFDEGLDWYGQFWCDVLIDEPPFD